MICIKCNVDKPLADFRIRSDTKKHRNSCIACDSKRAREYYLKNIELVNLRAREWQINNPLKAKIKHDNWVVKNRRRYNQARLEWRERNKLKQKAHEAVAYAVKIGKLTKQDCWECGDKGQAHHPDYSKPLDVIWLCPRHHHNEHMRLRKVLA